MAVREGVFDRSPDPANPGWRHWNLTDDTLFNGAVMGPLLSRVDPDGATRLRMVPERRHQNLMGIVHGAVTLGLIDIGLFAAIGDSHPGPAVTLELSTQFVGAGQPDRPLDTVTEIVRETGGLVFLRGTVVQGEALVASFTAIVRKLRPAAAAA